MSTSQAKQGNGTRYSAAGAHVPPHATIEDANREVVLAADLTNETSDTEVANRRASGSRQPQEAYRAPEKDYYEINPCLVILFLVGSIILCATLSSSFWYIRYDEYALKQDRYGTVRLQHVYEQGRYFFPLNYDMIVFPKTYQPVNIDAVVFTETGLEFDVKISFYYRLPKASLGAIYNSFSNNYNDLVESNAKTTIKNAAAPLKLQDYFSNRSAVQLIFAQQVRAVLAEIVLVDVPEDLFRITDVSLPDSIIELSLDSEIALQQNELLASSQQVSVTKAETDRLVASIDAKTNQTLNFASNRAKVLVERSKSYANQVEIRARAEGAALLLNRLGFGSNSTLSRDIVRVLAVIDNAQNTTVIESSLSTVQVQVEG